MPEFYKETERLILRSPTEGDAEHLAAARSTDFVMRYNLYRPCDGEQIRDELGRFQHVMLCRREDGALIGCIAVKDDYLRYRVASCSLQAWLSEDTAYHGYMAEALYAFIPHLFSACGYERISIQIFSDNTASLRLAEKLGFEREGYLKRAVANENGHVFDVVLLSMDQKMYARHMEKMRDVQGN